MVMNCLNAYVAACRLAFKRAPENSFDKLKCDPGKAGQTCYYSEMYTMLSTLRNFLSCYKCGKLASDAVNVSDNNELEHDEKLNEASIDFDEAEEELSNGKVSMGCLVICLGCAEKSMEVQEPAAQTRTLVQCYVKLCQYLQSSGFCNRNMGSNSGAASSRTQRDLTQLIVNGAGNRDGDGLAGDGLLSRIFSQPPVSGTRRRLTSDDHQNNRNSVSSSKRKRFSDHSKQGKMSRVRYKAGESNGGERKGCQCGHSTPRTGSSLTCFGQRCPCYSNGLGCHNCKCRGCKNPKKIIEQIEIAEPEKNLVEVFSVSSSTTSSSTISSSCSSSPQPEETL